MKVLIVGSVAYGGIENIRKLQEILRRNGFEVIDQFKEANYTDVSDFRYNIELCRKIVENDFNKVNEADVLVLLADRPSFGAMAETFYAYLKGKDIIALCKKELKSPWPIYFSKYIVKDEEELIKTLKNIRSKKGNKIVTIPNLYGKHEIELIYNGFVCICPITKIPDVATIRIRYIPKDKLIEYESLKEYFKSFKDKEMYHEEVVEKILNDIVNELNPEFLEIEAEFQERSNVKARIKKSWRTD